MGQRFGRPSKGFAGKKREVSVPVFGPKHAGKTTIIYRLKHDTVIHFLHPVKFTNEIINYENTNFVMNEVDWDDKDSWMKQRFPFLKCQAIIFVLDCCISVNDHINRNGFKNFVQKYGETMKSSVILIFANKQDIPGALTPDELVAILDLNKLLKGFRWSIRGVSAVTRDTSLHDGLSWLNSEFGLKSKHIQ